MGAVLHGRRRRLPPSPHRSRAYPAPGGGHHDTGAVGAGEVGHPAGGRCEPRVGRRSGNGSRHETTRSGCCGPEGCRSTGSRTGMVAWHGRSKEGRRCGRSTSGFRAMCRRPRSGWSAASIHPDAELTPARRRREPDAARRHRHLAGDGRDIDERPTRTGGRRRGAGGAAERSGRRRADGRPRRCDRPTCAPSICLRPTSPRRSTRSRCCASPRPGPRARPRSAARASSATRNRTGSPASPPGCGHWAPASRSTATTCASRVARVSRGATTDSLDDHRLAMTFAIAGLVATDPITIERPDSAAVSYPGFFSDLEGVRA